MSSRFGYAASTAFHSDGVRKARNGIIAAFGAFLFSYLWAIRRELRKPEPDQPTD